MRSLRPHVVAVLLVGALAGSACQPNVDLKTAVEVTDVTTGWYDAGVVEGQKNKLVPSISFRIKNTSDVTLTILQVNAVFRRVNEAEEWGSSFVKPLGPEGLPPGVVSVPIVLRSTLGYTGVQPRGEMLQNKEFVDAKVEIFGKHGSSEWAKLGEYPVQRQLLTR